jgi:cytochrome c-type biogenesis protein CcmH
VTPQFWIFAGGLLLLAFAFLFVPLWRAQAVTSRRSPGAALGSLLVVPVALGLYFLVSSYDAERDFVQASNSEELALLEQLAERLGANPDDVRGWTLLGRSFLELGDYPRARQALQEAWNRTATPDDMLKVSYAEAMLLTESASALTLAGDLIDQVLASAPDNQRALWWGGIVAVERGQPALAVERWGALLATNPPPDLAEYVRAQMLALAGESGRVATPATVTAGPVIALEVSIAPGMPVGALGPNTIVYLAARAPGGGPPLAARQIPLSSLPGRFEIGVADAMIPGRSIEGHERVTVIARISLTGEPTEQPGDIFGEAEVEVASGDLVQIMIEQIVPTA